MMNDGQASSPPITCGQSSRATSQIVMATSAQASRQPRAGGAIAAAGLGDGDRRQQHREDPGHEPDRAEARYQDAVERDEPRPERGLGRPGKALGGDRREGAWWSTWLIATGG
jgi:hypothetical protein